MTEQESTFTPIKAARYLGVSEASLRLWRSGGECPRYFRAGDKLVRYRRVDAETIETIRGHRDEVRLLSTASVLRLTHRCNAGECERLKCPIEMRGNPRRMDSA